MQTVPFRLVCVCFSRVSDKCDCEQIPVAGAENSSDEVLLPSLSSSGLFKATASQVEFGAGLGTAGGSADVRSLMKMKKPQFSCLILNK